MDFNFETISNLRTPHQKFPMLAPRANLRPVTTSRGNSTHSRKKDSLMLEIDFLQRSSDTNMDMSHTGSLHRPHSASYPYPHPVTSNTIVSTSDDADDSDVSSIGSRDDDDFLLCTPDRFASSSGNTQRMSMTPLMATSPFSLTPRKMTSAELPQIPDMISPLQPTPTFERQRNPKRKIGMY